MVGKKGRGGRKGGKVGRGQMVATKEIGQWGRVTGGSVRV